MKRACRFPISDAVCLRELRQQAPTWMYVLEKMQHFSGEHVLWFLRFLGAFFWRPHESAGHSADMQQTPVPLLSLSGFGMALCGDRYTVTSLVNILCKQGNPKRSLHVLNLSGMNEDSIFTLQSAWEHRDSADAFIMDGLGVPSNRLRMVCNSRITIPRRSKCAVCIDWTLPGFWVHEETDVANHRTDSLVDKLCGRTATLSFHHMMSFPLQQSTPEYRRLAEEAPALCQYAKQLHQALPRDETTTIAPLLPSSLSPMYQAVSECFIVHGDIPSFLVKSLLMPYLEDEFFHTEGPTCEKLRWSTSQEIVECNRVHDIRRHQAELEARADWEHQVRDQEQWIYTGNHFTGQRDERYCTLLTNDPTEPEWSFIRLAKLVLRSDYTDLLFEPALKPRYDMKARLPDHRHVRLSEFTRVFVGGRLPLSALFGPIELELFRELSQSSSDD